MNETTASIAELAAAFAKAQAEMENPIFDSYNPHFNSRYASLAAVRDAVIPAFAKNGIAVWQDVLNVDGGISCTTTLIHCSGQARSFGPLTVHAPKDDPQGLGTAATYAKRYQLMAIAVVAGDRDDDANQISGEDKITPAQVLILENLLLEANASKEQFLKLCRIDSLGELAARNFDYAVQRIEAKKKKTAKS